MLHPLLYWGIWFVRDLREKKKGKVSPSVATFEDPDNDRVYEVHDEESTADYFAIAKKVPLKVVMGARCPPHRTFYSMAQ